MKPTVNKKPTPKKPIGRQALQFRARNFLASHNMIAVQRTQALIGPIFIVDLRKGKVIAKNIADQAELAVHLGLLKPNERVA